MQNAWNRERIL